eukprot:7483804-Ditylum_brightwellii.AAC.1
MFNGLKGGMWQGHDSPEELFANHLLLLRIMARKYYLLLKHTRPAKKRIATANAKALSVCLTKVTPSQTNAAIANLTGACSQMAMKAALQSKMTPMRTTYLSTSQMQMRATNPPGGSPASFPTITTKTTTKSVTSWHQARKST